MSSFRSLTSRDNLMTAAGIGLGIAGGAYLLRQPWAANLPGNLPGAENKWTRTAWLVGLTVVGASLIRKASPQLANGVAISGLAAIGIDLATQGIAQIKPVSAYLDGPNVRGMGRLLGPRNHSAVQMFSALPQDRQSAFPSSRYAVR